MINELVGLALFANFVGWQFEPIQQLKNLFKLYNLPWYFGKLFYCHICIAFWSGWIWTGSFYNGLATSFLSAIFYFVYKQMEKHNQE